MSQEKEKPVVEKTTSGTEPSVTSEMEVKTHEPPYEFSRTALASAEAIGKELKPKRKSKEKTEEDQPQPGDDQPSVANRESVEEYEAAKRKTREIFYGEKRGTWKLAFALADFQEAYRKRYGRYPVNNEVLAKELGVDLTPQRIGQLLGTAKNYPKEGFDPKIDFRVYEDARRLNNRTVPQSLRMDPAALLAFVKENPSRQAVKEKIGHLGVNKSRSKHVLRLSVISSTSRFPEIRGTFDGKVKATKEDIEWLEPTLAELRKFVDRWEKAIADFKAKTATPKVEPPPVQPTPPAEVQGMVDFE